MPIIIHLIRAPLEVDQVVAENIRVDILAVEDVHLRITVIGDARRRGHDEDQDVVVQLHGVGVGERSGRFDPIDGELLDDTLRVVVLDEHLSVLRQGDLHFLRPNARRLF